jgi:hypothetical protein
MVTSGLIAAASVADQMSEEHFFFTHPQTWFYQVPGFPLTEKHTHETRPSQRQAISGTKYLLVRRLNDSRALLKQA